MLLALIFESTQGFSWGQTRNLGPNVERPNLLMTNRVVV